MDNDEEAALRLAALELLSNAIKFTPPGGKIAVSCAASPLTEVNYN